MSWNDKQKNSFMKDEKKTFLPINRTHRDLVEESKSFLASSEELRQKTQCFWLEVVCSLDSSFYVIVIVFKSSFIPGANLSW